MQRPPTLAGLVLAGGRSRRMGSPKALAERDGVPLVGHVAGVLASVCSPVVVCHAAGQELPGLPEGVELVADSVADRGPLQAIADGHRVLAGRCDAVFVAATDLPLLTPRLVAELAGLLRAQDDAVVPVRDGRRQSLAAVYRPAVTARAERLLASGERRAAALVEGVRVREVAAAELSDPAALTNVNTPQELEQALRRGG